MSTTSATRPASLAGRKLTAAFVETPTGGAGSGASCASRGVRRAGCTSKRALPLEAGNARRKSYDFRFRTNRGSAWDLAYLYGSTPNASALRTTRRNRPRVGARQRAGHAPAILLAGSPM